MWIVWVGPTLRRDPGVGGNQGRLWGRVEWDQRIRAQPGRGGVWIGAEQSVRGNAGGRAGDGSGLGEGRANDLPDSSGVVALEVLVGDEGSRDGDDGMLRQ